MTGISLYNLTEIAKKKNLEFKNQDNKRLKELNPELHLRKLLESHNFSHQDEDITHFFTSISNDDFFNKNMMPGRWNHKTWSESMRSMQHILKILEIKNHLISKIGQDRFNNILAYCDKKRREYMKLYRNSQKKTDNKNIQINTQSLSSSSSSSTSSISDEIILESNENDNSIFDFSYKQKIVKTHILRIINAKEDDKLLRASLENIIDILDNI